jgi:hypothetical protein
LSSILHMPLLTCPTTCPLIPVAKYIISHSQQTTSVTDNACNVSTQEGQNLNPPGGIRCAHAVSLELANYNHMMASIHFASMCASHSHHLPLSLLLKTSCQCHLPLVCTISMCASIPVNACYAHRATPCLGPCITELALAVYSIIVFICMSLVTFSV